MMTLSFLRNFTFSTLCLGVAACGSSSEEAFKRAASGAEGIYTITLDTENALGCAEEGTSLIGEGTEFALVKSAKYGFSPALFYLRCLNLDDCRVQFDQFEVINALNADATVFSHLDALGNFRGGRITTGFWQDDGTCRDAEKDEAILSIDDNGTLEFVVERYLIEETQQDVGGYCTTDGTSAALDSAVCQSVQASSGTLIEVR